MSTIAASRQPCGPACFSGRQTPYITRVVCAPHRVDGRRTTSVVRAAPGAPEPTAAPPLVADAPSASTTPVAPPDAVEVTKESAGVYTAMAALAGVGVMETAYLTFVKLFNAPLVCPTSGCDTVLSSNYAELFGMPLSLAGMLAYGTVAGLALLRSQQAAQGAPQAQRETVSLALAGGVSALVTTSAFLVFILQTRFAGSPCAWCYLSAALSAALAVLTASSLSRRQAVEAMGPGLGMVAATAAMLYFGVPGVGELRANANGDSGIYRLEYKVPVIATQSSEQAYRVVARLRATGAQMYGAFWCSHCQEQKEVFGAQAAKDLPYVECFPNGWERGAKLAPACTAIDVQAFPTWVIGGKKVEAELTLSELEKELDQADAAAAAALAAPAPAAAVVAEPAPAPLVEAPAAQL